ncbi:MAG: FkbM family methyltransferase [Synergistaceae bacterium]|nr:FkbM family methyltransferase [Synergistaceae bacterium]
MSIKTFFKTHSPYYVYPAIRMLFKHIQRKRIPQSHKTYAEESERYKPFLKDELSRKIWDDRQEYLRTGNEDVFIRRAYTEGFSFSSFFFFHMNGGECFQLLERGGEWHFFRDKTPGVEQKYSGAVILWDKEGQNLERAKMFLETCPPLRNYRLLNVSGLSGTNRPREDEIIINTVINPLKLMRAGKYIRHCVCVSSNMSFGSEKAQYFDVFAPAEGETVLDVGACDGGTALQFLEWGGDKIRRVYAFEPDPVNIERCIEKLKGFADKVTLVEKGTWDKDETMYIDPEFVGGGTSKVSSKGKIAVQLSAIDSIMKDEPVTFIKMDIEGAELRALKGARNTIIRNHPRLAICVYHKPEDLCEIPGYILSLVPEYRFFLRHYHSSSAETVLYAYCE